MRIAVLGIDLGKNVCSVVGLDSSGVVVLRRRVRRDTLIDLVAKLPSCIVGMEACCGAHHLGRLFAAQGHDVRLMSPEYVRPYVKAQKNDDRDAEGIAEAATRPTMRFVEMKTQDQLDMQTLHRSRERLVGERTALINQLRAVLLDRGIVVPQGKRKLEQYLVIVMNEHDGKELSARMRMLVADIRAQWQDLDRQIGEFDAEFVRWAKENEDARRLVTIPGVGVTIATALIAAVGKAETFEHGRDLAASFQARRPPSRMPLVLPLLQQLQCRDSGFVQSPESRHYRAPVLVRSIKVALIVVIFVVLLIFAARAGSVIRRKEMSRENAGRGPDDST